MRTSERADTVPIATFDYTTTEPEGTWFRRYDELRAQFPWYRNEFGPGFWTVCNYQGILEIMQNPEVFSNSVVTALDPEPAIKWILEMLDGDEHKQWRRQLGPLFAPGAVARMESTVRQRAIELIDGIAERGSCDFMADFAARFPTNIFLDLMGPPIDELDQYLEWKHDILHAGGSDEEKLQKQMTAMFAVMGRFSTVIAERREEPHDDIVSKALNYEIDGKPVTGQDLLSFCLLMFMAGLDTVSVTLGWTFLHLARNDDDRKRIVTEPATIPTAVEEFVRAYAIVIPARKGDGRHRDSRMPDGGRRHSEHSAGCRDPRRRRLPRCDVSGHHSQAEQSHRFRCRTAPMSRFAPGPSRTPDRT